MGTKVGGKRIPVRWRIAWGIGSVLFVLTALTWLNADPVEACGVRCGGPHPTARPARRYVPPRPFQKPPQPAPPKPAAPVAKAAPTRVATARPAPLAPTATPRPATATPAPAAPRAAVVVPAPRLAAVGGSGGPAPAAPAVPTATAVPPTPTAMLTATAVPGPAQVTTAAPPVSASAQVNYLVQFYSLNDSRNAPKDMKDVLLANSFRPAARPEPGAVALFLPAYFKNANGYDGMKQDGMIGVVAGY